MHKVIISEGPYNSIAGIIALGLKLTILLKYINIIYCYITII